MFFYLTLVRSMRHIHKDTIVYVGNSKHVGKIGRRRQNRFHRLKPSDGKVHAGYILAAKRQTLSLWTSYLPFGWLVCELPMLQGAVESNLFYDVTPGHLYSEQDV